MHLLTAPLVLFSSSTQGVAFDEGAVARLMSYARAVAHFPTAVKEALHAAVQEGEKSRAPAESIVPGRANTAPPHQTQPSLLIA